MDPVYLTVIELNKIQYILIVFNSRLIRNQLRLRHRVVEENYELNRQKNRNEENVLKTYQKH